MQRLWGLLTGITMICVIGCAKRPAEDPSEHKPLVNETPNLVVEIETSAHRAQLPAEDLELLGQYRKANAYCDRATLTLTYQRGDGRREKHETQIETRYEAPNRIRLQVSSEDNRVVIVSDGKQITARIVDPVTQNFDNQVVVRDAPDKLSIATLYQVTELVDPIAPDEILSALLAVPAGLDVLPLSFFFNEGKLVELASAKSSHTSLGPMKLPDTNQICEVVEAKSEEGSYRFWIAEHTLRRIEFPPITQNLMPGVRQMDLVVEFRDITFSAADSDFAMDDHGGTQVRHFVLPTIPPATDKLGEAVSKLSFHNRHGEEVHVDNDDGQITVLAWFRDRPESRMILESIERVRRRNRSDRVRFAAVSGEATATHELLGKWSVETAWLEDRLAQGRDLLGIEQAPTVLVLGAKNTIQYFEVGANPNIGADIAAVVERLLGGQDVATVTKASAKATEEAYARLLARVKLDSDGWVEELDAKVPKAAQPKLLTLKEAWSTDKIKEPGNFLIVPGKRKQILVTDGWNHLAMLGLDGKLTRRIKLELPANEGISILRAGSNGRDRALIAAASRGGRLAFVFDFAGKLVMQYPPRIDEIGLVADQQFAISDVMIHDIDKNKDPELIVGWQGNGGVHGVGIDGKKRWTNQATPGVISLAAVTDKSSGSDRRPILVAGEPGLLFLVDEHGRTLREVRLDRVIHQLVSWPGSARGFNVILDRDRLPSGKDASVCVGISSSAIGGRVVTGINRDWATVWSHDMPGGVYRHQIDFPQTISIPDIGPTWLLPGSDGSVHFVSVDGKFKDQLFVGRHLRGIAAVRVDGAPLLLLSTDEKITALEITLSSPPASGTP